MGLRFTKYHGIGNDFVVVDSAEVDAVQAKAICDRHHGVGADGVLLVSTAGDRPRMRVINADGSTPEMCGNGIRCVAVHLTRTGAVDARAFDVDTDAGVHRVAVLSDGQVEVHMATPTLEPDLVPVQAEAPLVDAPFEVDGETVHVTAVSMGNPHAVIFDDVGGRRLTLGPRLETHPRFPRKVNVGFARPRAAGGIELAVWERGVGWTRACGTGACAAAVAAVETGRATRGEPVAVQLPGGLLTIVVDEPGRPVRMTGPARHVFDGELDLAELTAS